MMGMNFGSPYLVLMMMLCMCIYVVCVCVCVCVCVNEKCNFRPDSNVVEQDSLWIPLGGKVESGGGNRWGQLGAAEGMMALLEAEVPFWELQARETLLCVVVVWAGAPERDEDRCF